VFFIQHRQLEIRAKFACDSLAVFTERRSSAAAVARTRWYLSALGSMRLKSIYPTHSSVSISQANWSELN